MYYSLGKNIQGKIMEQRYETFTSLILNISRCVQKIKNVEMANLGLKGKQVQCLFALYNSDDGASVTALWELCGEDKGMMSRTLKELIAQGLVYVDEQEKRKYRNPIKLTEKGAEVAGIVSAKISEMVDLGSIGITENGRKQLYHSLSLISDNLTKVCNNYKG